MAKNKKKKNQQKEAAAKTNNKYTLANLVMPEGISDKIRVEIMAVIQSTQFDKISFPLSASRKAINTQEHDQDDRISTIGYIRKFDLEKNQFQVVIFNGTKDAVAKFKNPIIIPVITTYKEESLGTITKFLIDDAGEVAEAPAEETATEENKPETTTEDSSNEEAVSAEENTDHGQSAVDNAEVVAETTEEKPSKVPENGIKIPDEVKQAVAASTPNNVVQGKAVN